MNISYKALNVLIVTSLFFVYAYHADASSFQFTRSLQIGSSGGDVQELQKVLNSNLATKIQSIGIGSPGQETTYFGQLTKQSVIRFQELYRASILTPNGLASGTGFVGPATIKLLNAMDTLGKSGSSQTTVSQNSSSAGLSLAQQGLVKDFVDAPVSGNNYVAATSSNSSIPAVNPNLAHIDEVFAASDKAAAKLNIPPASPQLRETIRQYLSTTTDLRAKFVELARKKMPTGTVSSNGFHLDGSLFSKLMTSILPKKAEAQSGSDFGSTQIISAIPCTCSGVVWVLTLTPTSPAYVTILSYTLGTQIYLNYNLPYASSLLGKYSSGTQMCYMYSGNSCTQYPTEGWITPFVGSS